MPAICGNDLGYVAIVVVTSRNVSNFAYRTHRLVGPQNHLPAHHADAWTRNSGIY